MKTIDELVAEAARNAGILSKTGQTGKSALAAAQNVKPQSGCTCRHDSCQQDSDCVCKKHDPQKAPDSLTLDMAKYIAEAVETASGILGINTVTAICNEGANPVLLHSMDGAYIASTKVAQDKAYTAVALQMPTHKALEESRGGALDGLTNGNGIMLLGGGCPLKIADKIYGGVGVSGGSKEQDTLLALTAAEIFKVRFA